MKGNARRQAPPVNIEVIAELLEIDRRYTSTEFAELTNLKQRTASTRLGIIAKARQITIETNPKRYYMTENQKHMMIASGEENHAKHGRRGNFKPVKVKRSEIDVLLFSTAIV